MRKEYDFTRAKRAKDVPHLARLQAENATGSSGAGLEPETEKPGALKSPGRRQTEDKAAKRGTVQAPVMTRPLP